jgi:hypothetical protein
VVAGNRNGGTILRHASSHVSGVFDLRKPQPHQSALVGLFRFQALTAVASRGIPAQGNRSGGTYPPTRPFIGLPCQASGIMSVFEHHIRPSAPISPSLVGGFLFQAAAPAMLSAAMASESRVIAWLGGDCWIIASTGQSRGVMLAG